MDIADLSPGKEAECAYKQVLNGQSLSSFKHDNGQVVSNQNLMQQLAQSKIFTSIMLNAWRQRRADVRLLKQRVESLQKKAIKFKNELHVSRTLMRVQQKRCRELQLELTKSTLNIRLERKSYDELSNSLHSLKTENEQLEQKLNSVRTQQRANKEVLLEQRETSKQLFEQQSEVRRLKSDQGRMLKKMFEMENEYRICKESYVQQLEQKDMELRDMRLTKESLERLLYDQQKKRYDLKQNANNIEWTENTSQSSQTLLTQRAERKGVRQILSSLQRYTSAALVLLWIAFLPRKSQRYGCTP